MSSSEKDFVKATMQHFDVLRDAGFEPSKNKTRFPNDWFDFPPNIMADFGAMYFLASLSKFNRDRSLAQITNQLESPLRLGQYKIFRSNGCPRAFITWAGLDKEAERQFAIDHQPLNPFQWNSGRSTWLIDFVAPFGHIDQMIPQMTRNNDINRLRTLWHNKKGTRARVVEWWRPFEGGHILVKSYGMGQFSNLLKGN
ncbi:putative toxin-activating protein [Rhodobacteraceae bacterium HTCC2150]|nr:putative toxin-activating protein [Rhodobacteraceae bacterium HTCC2150]